MNNSPSFKLLIAAAAILFFSSSVIADCEFDDSHLSQQQFSAQVRGQRLTVIGWYHGNKELEVAIKTVMSALNDASHKQCATAVQGIEQALKMIGSGKVEEGKRVVRELDKIYAAHPFPFVGVEYSPELFRRTFFDPKTNTDLTFKIVPAFAKFCPDGANQFNRLAFVFPGPEIEFARKRKDAVQLEPLGDEKVTQTAMAGLSEETKQFSQTLNKLSPESRLAYDKYGALFKKGTFLTSKGIEDLIQNVTEPERTRLKRYMTEVNNAVTGSLDAVNSTILAGALAKKKDIVIVIGNAHVAGLRRQLEKRCKGR